MAVSLYDPTFIIKCGDDYYVTNSVAAYIKADAKSGTDQADDISEVASSFENLQRTNEQCVAIRVPKTANLLARQATNKK